MDWRDVIRERQVEDARSPLRNIDRKLRGELLKDLRPSDDDSPLIARAKEALRLERKK